METSELLRFTLSSLVFKVPVLAVLIGGIIYSIVNYSKRPKVNRRVLSGLIILLAVEIFSVFLPLLNVYFYKNDAADSISNVVSYTFGFLLSIGFAAGLALILWAVWTNQTSE